MFKIDVEKRQLAAPRLKTQLEIGKEYNDTPWGRKNAYAAMSPFGDSVLRRYAKKYKESLTKGTISGKVIGGNELICKTRVIKPNARVKFPNAEEKLFEKFKELRKVGIKVDGNYLQAKMLQYVEMETGADPEKVKAFKATNPWRKAFCDRYDISLRVQTNKKSRSAIKRSRIMRNFHWFMMYKAPLTYSDRKS